MDEVQTARLQPAQDEAPAKSKAKAIGVLIKAFDVMELMSEIREPAPLRDIAKASGLPKGTLYRLLQTLVGLGYVSQIADSGAYFLTSKLSYLGHAAREEEIKTRLIGPMKRLHETFNETVNLGVLDAPYVNYVAVLEARRALSWSVPAGARDLFYCTALGRAIVAYLPQEKRTALVEQTQLTSRTANTVMSRETLYAMLDTVRATGIALDIEENDDGVVCVGTPVFLDGSVVASLSVSVPSSRYSDALGSAIAAQFRDLDLSFHSDTPC